MWHTMPFGVNCHHESVSGLRERKKQATRESIAAVALRLFARDGYDAVTVADVAREAQVAPRTLFRYFPTKDELLFGEDQAIIALVGDAITREKPGDPRADLLTAAEAWAAWCTPRREQLVARDAVLRATPALRGRELAKQAEMRAALAALLAQRLGHRPDDLVPAVWAAHGLACLDAATTRWVRHGGHLRAHLRRALAVVG